MFFAHQASYEVEQAALEVAQQKDAEAALYWPDFSATAGRVDRIIPFLIKTRSLLKPSFLESSITPSP